MNRKYKPLLVLFLAVIMSFSLASPACFRIVSGGDVSQNDPPGSLESLSGKLSRFRQTSSLPVPLREFGTCALNGRIYVVGGLSTEGGQANTYFSAVNEDGTLETWTETTPLPVKRWSFGCVQARGWIFVLGGGPDEIADTALRAQINAEDGTLGDWVSAGSLPTPLVWNSATVAYQNRIFIVGGAIPGPQHPSQKSVYLADVRPDGSLSPWQATTPMQYARDSSSALVHNGYIYVLGGVDNKVDDTQDLFHSVVEWAEINSDGSLGDWLHSWHGVENLSPPRTSLGSARIGDYVYAMGGNPANAAPPLSSVVFSHFRPDGSLDQWMETSSLPRPFSRGGTLAVGKRVYVIGGNSVDESTTDTVYFASVQ